MDREQPPISEHEAKIYHFPTPRERAMRRHPASGKETIGETLGRIGVDSASDDEESDET